MLKVKLKWVLKDQMFTVLASDVSREPRVNYEHCVKLFFKKEVLR